MLAESCVEHVSRSSSIRVSHKRDCYCIRRTVSGRNFRPGYNLHFYRKDLCSDLHMPLAHTLHYIKCMYVTYYKWMTSDTTLPVCPLQPSNPHLWALSLLILPFSSPAPPRQGQVLAEPPPPLRGRAACSGKNLCGDRCAYQTPALSPVPRRSHNYLLARLPQLSSNAELNISKEHFC